ncbi:hypothetical protein BK133_08400 [Paenibacillus sp. FSL H8-0548]|uniref:hypothetical protein n=1 Tax=Paenibacillus sp. FSL H8-0548 TaxID=1920422 RepID=UPI00096F46FA|nr:hypothetical protein [Paenibacillus sp. FSL H8-0548]OMF36923.1 hypothetical protein BK133_08400 [Paenibacillus sp. FSL H8-0548]
MIPAHTVFHYPSNETIRISDVAKVYEERMKAASEEVEDELSFISNKILGYESKYEPLKLLEQRIQSGEIFASDGGLDFDVCSYLVKRKKELLVHV